MVWTRRKPTKEMESDTIDRQRWRKGDLLEWNGLLVSGERLEKKGWQWIFSFDWIFFCGLVLPKAREEA